MTEDPINATMSGVQFPIVSNSCRTGHKLQGCTLECLVVNDWHYGSNWAYGVLSRLKTMVGLYFRTPLSTNLERYEMKEDMLEMLEGFRASHSLADISDNHYGELQRKEDRWNRPPN